METKPIEVLAKQYPNNQAADQPIDLTSIKKIKNEDLESNSNDQVLSVSSSTQNKHYSLIFAQRNSSQNVRNAPQLQLGFCQAKRERRRFACTPDGKLYVMDNTTPLTTLQREFKDEKKEAEILKAAKSLFTKRTRTLYHWIYPNAPKQQIKAAVLNSWNALGKDEKEFYISQVLGRFGFTQSNLMVNPQIGGLQVIRPLPPLTPAPGKSEMQTAISSISGCLQKNDAGERKRRRGRPSRNAISNGECSFKKRKEDIQQAIANDFQDDPELSKELQQFALNTRMFKNKI